MISLPRRFSLRALVVAVTLVSVFAAYCVWQEPKSYTRYAAPGYVIEMMDEVKVEWDLDAPGLCAGKMVIDYPRDPDHNYFMVMTFKSPRHAILGSAGPVSPFRYPPKAIGHATIGISQAQFDQLDFNKDHTTIWGEIIIEDQFGKVIFHGVKESIPYEEALAELMRNGGPKKQRFQWAQ
ncbi:hypothetical protein AB1L30_18090 [Bremerella sp. JC817]|uniref:hypothetical protein n=1 Tax=Bremerella sp. JC817 TaxID=3231756 RepID=UPI0034598FD0